MNNKILLIVAHPHLSHSRANKAIVQSLEQVQGITLRLLYDLYPDFYIDQSVEQSLLEKHDLICIQHPLYWYSMPALLKQWLDQVWESGWAYGQGGDKLQGKDFLLSITAGGPADAYHETGYNNYPLDTLLTPWKQTAHLCGLNWQKPHFFYRALKATDTEVKNNAENLKKTLLKYLETGKSK